ncbi:MAG: efflux RND transporter periplasmic adaptor subunit [Acidobacteriota bacterium]
MNNEEENLIEADLPNERFDETYEDNYLSDDSSREVEEEKPLVKSRKIYIIGGLIALSVAFVLIWLYATRNSGGGKPVPAPRNVSFGETDAGNDALKTGEQTITISPEQLEAANLKIVTVGEDLSVESSATSATGVVQPNDYKETPVMSLVGGVVRRINVELGQLVRAGQTIAVIYSDELAAVESNYLSKRAEVDEADKRYKRAGKLTDIAAESRSELDAATAAVKIAEADHIEHLSHFSRTGKLLEIGAVSREEFEMARAKHETAQAKLDEAESRLERAKKLLNINPARRAELDNALTQLKSSQAELASMRQKLLVLGLPAQKVNSLTSTTQISSELPVASPVSGTITARKVNQGEVVSANAELLTVTNLSTVWVIGQVYERDLSKLRTGSGASVTTDAYPGEVFRGNVSYIDPNLDQNTRTAQVRIELPNSGEKFKVGMYVNIAFANLGGSENTVPTVPIEAVQTINNQQIVFLATENPNVFVMKSVKIGAESNGLYPVLEGLFVGDKVVTEGSFLLRAEWQKSHQNS